MSFYSNSLFGVPSNRGTIAIVIWAVTEGNKHTTTLTIYNSRENRLHGVCTGSSLPLCAGLSVGERSLLLILYNFQNCHNTRTASITFIHYIHSLPRLRSENFNKIMIRIINGLLMPLQSLGWEVYLLLYLKWDIVFQICAVEYFAAQQALIHSWHTLVFSAYNVISSNSKIT